jgi:hypothetical protein
MTASATVSFMDNCHGLTKREHFSALALGAILSNSWQMEVLNNNRDVSATHKAEIITGMAVEYADLLIAALNKEAK